MFSEASRSEAPGADTTGESTSSQRPPDSSAETEARQPVVAQQTGQPESAQQAASPRAGQPAETPAPAVSIPPPQRIKIGSQRPASPPVKATPPLSAVPPAGHPASQSPASPPARSEPPPATPPHTSRTREREDQSLPSTAASTPPPRPEPQPAEVQPETAPRSKKRAQTVVEPPRKFPVPNIRSELPLELELEVAAALGGLSLDEVLDPAAAPAAKEYQPEERAQARVVSVHRDNVFVTLGGRDQGLLSLRQFAEPPQPGALIEVVVGRFDPEEGLYQLTLPGAAADVGDWSDVSEGMLVEARITGHNKGGLECEVNRLRGVIPISQVSMYRVDDLAQFVGEKMTCVVTEANPEKRNLVLSRRDAIERDRAEAKTRLMSELAEGQVREGVVRSLRDYGAFVDLGGVDGLLHVSQLAWQRVKHPSEVLQLGQTINVKIKKIDAESGKISLALRDLTENPWTTAAQRYPVTSTVAGTVTKIMEFGAFVELEPGIEGLVHISELAHGRVWRAGDVVKEGQQVEAKVLSVDVEQQRIGLSMKALMARAEPAKKPEPEVEEPAAASQSPKRQAPLKGGTGRASGGDQFGLKW
ncbi:MAG: S1 RNA-binding domain-containing protein [Pirellulales bacterium]